MCHAWAMGRKDSKLVGADPAHAWQGGPGDFIPIALCVCVGVAGVRKNVWMLRHWPGLMTPGGHSPERAVWEEKKLGEWEVTP